MSEKVITGMPAVAPLFSRRSEIAAAPIELDDFPMTNLPEQQLVEIACEYFPAQVREEYAGLLRQLAEGGATPSRECCRRIAEQLAARKVTARLALKFHLATMEAVIETMGPSCAKKVLTCGDMVVLELMSALSEAYGRIPSFTPPPNSRRKTWVASGVR